MNGKSTYLKRNYLLAVIEGGFFMGGMNFLSMESVMPAMVDGLGGPRWAVSLAPVLFILGFCWPQLFSALWVERLRHMMPFIRVIGFIQRLPYLVAGLLLIFAGSKHPQMALIVVIMVPFLMSSLGGLIGSAYFELVRRIIPVNRTASFWALRNILMALFGLSAGLIIKGVLDKWPGTHGYGILHLIVFGMMMVSFSAFFCIQETNVPRKQKPDPVTFRIGFATFARQWRRNPSLGRFILARILYMLIFVAIPFLSLRAIERTGEPTSLVGLLVMTQMAGFVTGNVISGYLGDRLGVRLPMILGRVCLLTAIAIAVVAASVWQFLLVFFFLGCGISTAQVGDMTMTLDFAPSYRRKFFFAVMSVLAVPGVVIAVGLSTLLQYAQNGFFLACLVSMTSIALSLGFLLKMDDPRGHPYNQRV